MAQPDGYADRISIPHDEDEQPVPDPSVPDPLTETAAPASLTGITPPPSAEPSAELPPLPPKWSEYEQRVTEDVLRPALAAAGVDNPEQYRAEIDTTPLLRDVPPGELGYVPHRVEIPEAVMVELAGPDVTEAHDPGQPEEYAGADVPDPWAVPAVRPEVS